MTYTHSPADEPTTAAGHTPSGEAFPLRGAPLQSAAPVPSAEAFTAASESAAALRAGVVVPVTENVGRGVLFSLLAIPVGVGAAVLIWQLGFIASITSFAIAAGAAWLYARGAGAAPRAGLIPLILVILTGVVLSFMSIVVADMVQFYNSPEGADLGWDSLSGFILGNIFAPEVLGSYGTDMAMFGLFAVLGVFSTVRRLLAAGRA